MAAQLLPPNASPTELNLEQATARLGEVPVPIRDLFSAARCPVALLPWLAWALSVDEWHGDWPEANKRAAIASSIEVHRRKGTVAAVRAALAALGVQVQLEEWFDTGEAPYTFKLHALVNQNLIPGAETLLTGELYAAIRRTVDATKPVSRHYSLSVGVQFNQALAMALPMRGRQLIRRCVEPEAPVKCITGTAGFQNALVARAVGVVRRVAQPAAQAICRPLPLTMALTQRTVAVIRIYAEPV